MIEKTCNRCCLVKPLLDFYKYEKRGTWYATCRSCWREKGKSFYEENKEKYKPYYAKKHTEWKAKNPDRFRQLTRESWARNKDKYKIKAVLRQPDINARSRERRRTDPAFAIRGRLSSRLTSILRNNGAKKEHSVTRLVGCSLEALVKHIESLFLPGMSWEKRHLFDIDHIRPCASFDLTNVEQQKICFHYTNLQPLWSVENKRKSARLDYKPDLTLRGS